MRHSFVYRGIWIDVVLHEKEGRCLWTCRTAGASRLRSTGSRAVSMGEGLRLACVQARLAVDHYKDGSARDHG